MAAVPRLPRLPSLIGLLAWIPQPEEALPVVMGRVPPRALRRGEPFSVLTWNLQFGGTRRHHYFYDGGPDVYVTADDVRYALAGMTATLREADADLVLLQEVDRGSDRTGRVDELVPLLDAVQPTAWAATPYHRVAWLPHPPRSPLGRVDMSLAVLSRFPLRPGRRIALPPLREPWIRQQLNLQRALAVVTVPGEDGADLAVGCTHLSAFSRGDGTMPAQVAVLRQWIDECDARGLPGVLGGDLNLLPPGDDPARLGRDAADYADRPAPVARLLEAWPSVFPPEARLDPANRTYLPPGATEPDRVLDYLVASPAVEVLDARVIRVDPLLSDHWPVRATLRLR